MSDRSLRHKTVPVYDNDDQVEDEIAGNRTYDVGDKLISERYSSDLVLEMKDGTELTFQGIQKNGFDTPLRIKNREGLGMTLPDDGFTVTNVKQLVGSRRLVDVMECNTQRGFAMPMSRFEKYFLDKENRKHIYNVISLEFSHSKLEPYVQRPKVVDHLDWIDIGWPPHLKDNQVEQSNSMNEMQYPKVQKYCLMSVAGCYTDFHIDFGGTSVWYHILKGGKIFWLIPPTDDNLSLYERWTMSGNQGDVFFADLVSDCQRIRLHAGDSLMIPSGWIHSVYTPLDSLVFGGNFLNSFNIPMQLKIAELETRIKVPDRFRFPFYKELSWYVLDRYVHCLMGRSFLARDYKTLNYVDDFSLDHAGLQENGEVPAVPPKHLTRLEIEGFTKLVAALSALPPAKRFVPRGIADPDALLETAQLMLQKHGNDNDELSVTGQAIATWPIVPKKPSREPKVKKPRSLVPHTVKAHTSTTVKKTGTRVRRVRCKQCDACQRDDCQDCVYCKDMKKFGGPGTMKQTCLKRRCKNPILPSRAKEELKQREQQQQQQEQQEQEQQQQPQEVEPIADAPEEPIPEVSMTSSMEGEMDSSQNGSLPDESNGSVEYEQVAKDEPPEKIQRLYKSEFVDYASNGLDMDSDSDDDEMKENRPRIPRILVKRVRLEDKMKYPIEPAVNGHHEAMETDDNKMIGCLPRNAWMKIFEHTSQDDLRTLTSVCQPFLSMALDQKFWRECNFDHYQLTPAILEFIVRRAPTVLSLESTNISYPQMLWLIKRLPNLRSLCLSRNSWSVIPALMNDSAPLLTTLDISWLNLFEDENLRSLFDVPLESRPGRGVPQSRISFCRNLNLAGLNITDVSFKLIASRLMHLESINVSYTAITDSGVEFICSEGSATLKTMIAQCCSDLSNDTIASLAKVTSLREVDLSRCMQIGVGKCLWLCEQNPALRPSNDPKHLVPK